MDNDGQYQWCWHRLQRMSVEVCKMRIQKGTCRLLDSPKKLDSKTAAFFNAESETVSCQEVNRRHDSISD